jgi:hypothetical protein
MPLSRSYFCANLSYPADFSSQGFASEMPRFVRKIVNNEKKSVLKEKDVVFQNDVGARMPTLTEVSWICMPSYQRQWHWEVVQRLVLD